MALELRITLRAAAQIEEADRWWVENRPSVPGAVRTDVEAAFTVLLVQPGIGATVANAKLVGVRRLHLGRIRYHLYYASNPANSLCSRAGTPVAQPVPPSEATVRPTATARRSLPFPRQSL